MIVARTAQGNVGCDQLLRNDVNCTDVFTTGVDASGAVSCAALTAAGTVARARDRGQHGQRGLQHELHKFVGQQGADGDGRGRRGRASATVRLRGGQAVQAPGHERGPKAGGHREVERTSVLWEGRRESYFEQLRRIESLKQEKRARDLF